MRIGIDISQLAYENTGVANYLKNLVEKLVEIDDKNEYVLFFSSMRRNIKYQILNIKNTNQKVKIKTFRIPPTLLDIIWNRLHIAPIEWFIGDVDVFITSDWTQPSVRHAKKVSIIYDTIVYKYPEETHHNTEFNIRKMLLSPNIVEVQKRAHKWMRKECSLMFCISESTKKDAIEILGIPDKKLYVIYPGI